jgi:hypothetical protein
MSKKNPPSDKQKTENEDGIVVSNLTTLVNAINNLNTTVITRMDHMESNLNTMKDDLNTLKTDVNTLKTDIQNLPRILLGETALAQSNKTAVFIEVEVPRLTSSTLTFSSLLFEIFSNNTITFQTPQVIITPPANLVNSYGNFSKGYFQTTSSSSFISIQVLKGTIYHIAGQTLVFIYNYKIYINGQFFSSIQQHPFTNNTISNVSGSINYGSNIIPQHYSAVGSIVQLNNQSYIATNRHLLTFSKSNPCFVSPILAILSNNISLTFNLKEIIISSDPNIDLGLIPIKDLHLPFSSISSRFPKTGEKLFGISYQKNIGISIQCEITEIQNDTIITNCAGAPGFSGTGLFTYDQYLTVIHVGSISFQHSYDAGETEEKFLDKVDIFQNECLYNNPPKDINFCKKEFPSLMGIYARNPTAIGVAAIRLGDVLHSGHKFNQSFTCSSY